MEPTRTPNRTMMRFLVGIGVAMVLISLPGAVASGADVSRWGTVASGASIALIGASALVPERRKPLLAAGLALGVAGLVLAFL